MINKRVLKKTNIKTKTGGRQERIVIELASCLDSIKKCAQVNLIDYSHFKYQVLIGRSFLRPEFLADSGKTFSAKPHYQ